MNKMKNTQDHFEVLRKIQKKPDSSQRELAQELGFSLGKLNYCLKALQKKGACCAGSDINDARLVSNKLGIKYLIYHRESQYASPKEIEFHKKMLNSIKFALNMTNTLSKSSLYNLI